jgi:hypothetical protein
MKHVQCVRGAVGSKATCQHAQAISMPVEFAGFVLCAGCCAGTYDWAGELEMQPNPFTRWGITGVVPAASLRRSLLTMLSTPSRSNIALASTHASISSCRGSTACAGTRPGRCVLAAADSLPVQGRVSVRESQVDNSATGDGEISAVVPGAAPTVVPWVSAPAAPTTTVLGLQAATQPTSQLSPLVIGCIAAGVFVLAAFGIVIMRRRGARQPTEQPMARQQTLQELLNSCPVRPADSRSTVCTPRHVDASVWSEVSHTEVQSLRAGEVGWDSSFGGRPVLPPARDSLTDD